jgi:hypothetical protein
LRYRGVMIDTWYLFFYVSMFLILPTIKYIIYSIIYNIQYNIYSDI